VRTHLDLFSGIGGFALAARWAGLVTVQFVEIDQRCRDFLSRTWPGVAIHDDVRTFHHDGGPVFLLTGGVPCQPASRAGKQRGCQDDRWLWPEAIRILGEVKPTWAIFENPPGIGDVGLAGILSDVEAQGYEMRVFSVPACAVGSPHRRERYWIVGKSIKDGRKQGEPTVPPTRHGRASQSNVSGILADAPRRQDDGGRDGDMAEAEGCRWGCDASAGCAGEHWPTPREGSEEGYDTRNARKGHTSAMSYLERNLEYSTRGQAPSGCLARTEKFVVRLMTLSAWLMGYTGAYLAHWETASSRKSRQRSLGQS